MSLTLDHIFILVQESTADIAAADEIVSFGLTEGSCNDHPGQGTANRRFFFDGFTLELLYIRDTAEADNGAGAGLNLVQRRASETASPFGLVFRITDELEKPPFPFWKYYPDYFHGQHYFLVGNNSNELEEPLVICMPTTLPMRSIASETDNPAWLITNITVRMPMDSVTDPLATATTTPQLVINPADTHHLQIEFNNGAQGATKHFDTLLPLSIHC